MPHPVVLMTGDINDGDRIRWTMPAGSLMEATVRKVIGFPETELGYAVDFFEQSTKATNGIHIGCFQRTVPLNWITHRNKKRLSRQNTDFGVESGVQVQVSRKQTELTIGKEPEMAATKTAAKKPAARKPVSKTSRVPQGSRKSLEQMSDSHRAHVEKWEPHMGNLKAEFVWIAVARIAGRGIEGLHYVAIKRGAKDYAIVSYDTADPKPITKRNVEAEGFESSTAMMESFKEYRKLAKEQRQGGKSVAKPKAATKPAPKPKPKTKPAAKQPARKAPPARSRKPKA